MPGHYWAPEMLCVDKKLSPTVITGLSIPKALELYKGRPRKRSILGKLDGLGPNTPRYAR